MFPLPKAADERSAHVIVPEEAVDHVPHTAALVHHPQQVSRATGRIVISQEVQEGALVCRVDIRGNRMK